MSIFVERLKSLFVKDFITVAYLYDLLSKSKITQEEYDYIVS